MTEQIIITMKNVFNVFRAFLFAVNIAFLRLNEYSPGAAKKEAFIPFSSMSVLDRRKPRPDCRRAAV